MMAQSKNWVLHWINLSTDAFLITDHAIRQILNGFITGSCFRFYFNNTIEIFDTGKNTGLTLELFSSIDSYAPGYFAKSEVAFF